MITIKSFKWAIQKYSQMNNYYSKYWVNEYGQFVLTTFFY